MNYHKFRGFRNRNLLSRISGGQSLKLAEIKESAGLVLPGGFRGLSFLALQLPETPALPGS